jgi:glutathione S-transferase
MKLYYSPGACSLSPHIALHEAGLPHELVKVDLRAKKLENGDDYLKVNPKGQVPALLLDNGELVTEGPVIVQMIADKAAAKNLAPAASSPERYKLQEWLTYINGELHKNIGRRCRTTPRASSRTAHWASSNMSTASSPARTI